MLRFGALLWAARTLGPSRFGAIGIGLGLAGFLLALNAGLALFGTRAIAADPDRPQALVGRLVGARLAIAAVLYGATAIAVTAIVQSQQQRIVLLVYALVVFTDAATLRWAYVGLQETGGVAIAGSLAAALYLAAVVLFVRGADDLAFVPLAHVAGEALIAVALILLARQRLRGWRPAIDWRLWVEGLRESASMTVTKASRSVLLTVDTLMVSVLISSIAAGNYAAPQRLTIVAMLFVGLLYETSLPAFVTTFQRSTDAGVRLVWATTRHVAMIVVPGAIIAGLLARPLINLAIGHAYDESIGLLRVLVWGVALSTLAGPFITALWALGADRLVATVTVVAAASNIALNLALLPTVGVMGAAIADALAKGLLFGLVVATLHRRVRAGRAQDDTADPIDLAGIPMGDE